MKPSREKQAVGLNHSSTNWVPAVPATMPSRSESAPITALPPDLRTKSQDDSTMGLSHIHI